MINAPLVLDKAEYNDFSSWIPRYYKPETPCDYCRSRGLECFTFTGQTHCSPCNTLFRECSFSRTWVQEQTSVDKHSGKFLDTLHVVSEDVTQHRGTFTGSRTLKSSGGNITPAGSDDLDPASRKSGNRFPKSAVKVLKDWLSSHTDHPYPTDEERDMLKRQTGLKTSQISNWLANARRRSKAQRPN
ncbi:hypothetical protein LTR60_006785, partial [Cryomyces antarcticus]